MYLRLHLAVHQPSVSISCTLTDVNEIWFDELIYFLAFS
jgi:hypothetical protein